MKLGIKGSTIETWNLRTLHACDKVHELKHEQKRYRIAAKPHTHPGLRTNIRERRRGD
ncbi:hypothetical protein DPMN_099933 [Dreissena polymorpha]|uniref:Uncharacterized protein n=1 Tax=Dreissena polymorpha TaxID=45954 RepID=A0A9D4R6W4_DREPO|nr:hypothetical protein DPMN_099933 [Dreissena polymorpha]